MIRSLRSWGLSVDEIFFLGGIDKGRIMSQFRPHIFFDDQLCHLDSTRAFVPSVHIPFGVANNELCKRGDTQEELVASELRREVSVKRENAIREAQAGLVSLIINMEEAGELGVRERDVLILFSDTISDIVAEKLKAEDPESEEPTDIAIKRILKAEAVRLTAKPNESKQRYAR